MGGFEIIKSICILDFKYPSQDYSVTFIEDLLDHSNLEAYPEFYNNCYLVTSKYDHDFLDGP